MLESMVMFLISTLLFVVVIKTLISLVKLSNDNFEYCRNELKKSCNSDDYNYCNRLRI